MMALRDKGLWPFLLALLLVLPDGRVESAEDAVLLKRARQAARQGEVDFAYMNYRQLMRQFPDSVYRKDALFAKAEYYYALPDYKMAQDVFEEYLASYPDGEETIFVLAHLLKIAELAQEQGRFKTFKKNIIDQQQVSLIFKDHKELSFRSPLAREYRVVFLIDTIEFYIEGELFAKLDY